MNLRRGDSVEGASRDVAVARWLLPVGWSLVALGFLGPWVKHHTAALSLSGADLGEFVKFLPGMLDGSLTLVRQLFYLPPFAVVTSLALLINSPRLGYRWFLRMLGLLLAVFVSLQLLPPAWSPSSLGTDEFRTQTLGLAICWVLLLASPWLLGRVPLLLASLIGAALCAAALALCIWQSVVVMPEVAEIYNTAPALGWGFWLCVVGLGIAATVSAQLALAARPQPKTRRATG